MQALKRMKNFVGISPIKAHARSGSVGLLTYVNVSLGLL